MTFSRPQGERRRRLYRQSNMFRKVVEDETGPPSPPPTSITPPPGEQYEKLFLIPLTFPPMTSSNKKCSVLSEIIGILELAIF